VCGRLNVTRYNGIHLHLKWVEREKKESYVSKLAKEEKKRPCGGVVFIEVAHPSVCVNIQIIGLIEISKI
jgi:hypothetical protein